MKRTSICAFVFVLVLSGSTSGCRFFRRAKPAPPPPPPASPAAAQTPPPPAAPAPTLPAPPAVPTEEPGPPPPGTEMPTAPAPPKPQPAPARKRPSPAPQTAPQPPPATPPAPATPAPQLGQILTPEQRREYNGIIDMRIARAQRNLSLISGKNLTQVQRTTVTRIETFIRQAGAARKDDLVTARNLAERADLLAQDLANSLQ